MESKETEETVEEVTLKSETNGKGRERENE